MATFTYFDQVVYEALRKRQKVELCLSRGDEGGFGIKINEKIVSKNNPWEVFEYNEDEMQLSKGTFNKIVKDFAILGEKE